MKRQKIRKLLLLISFLLFPATLYYLSPVLIIVGGFSGIVTGSFILFAAQFIFSLFFGRAFCGWVCPAGGLQECCFQVNDKRVTKRKVDLVKYIIWVPWLMTILLGFISSGGIRGINVPFMTDYGLSVTSVMALIIYLFFVALIAVLSLTLGKRGMCHSLCWMAPFMILGTKLKDRLGYRSLHLAASPDKCVQCGICTKVCPMSLDVASMVKVGSMQSSECILCGGCADHCGKKAIALTFKK